MKISLPALPPPPERLRRVIERLPVRPPSILIAMALNRTLLPKLDADARSGLAGRCVEVVVNDFGVRFRLQLGDRGFAPAAAAGRRCPADQRNSGCALEPCRGGGRCRYAVLRTQTADARRYRVRAAAEEHARCHRAARSGVSGPAIDSAQPWEQPNSAKRSSPAASTTASRSAIQRSSDSGLVGRSDRPQPRPS
jgi:hypothetical protein